MFEGIKRKLGEMLKTSLSCARKIDAIKAKHVEELADTQQEISELKGQVQHLSATLECQNHKLKESIRQNKELQDSIKSKQKNVMLK
jgi:TolA-binding protein